MNEITPELVAQVASRLFNELPADAQTSPSGAAPASSLPSGTVLPELPPHRSAEPHRGLPQPGLPQPGYSNAAVDVPGVQGIGPMSPSAPPAPVGFGGPSGPAGSVQSPPAGLLAAFPSEATALPFGAPAGQASPWAYSAPASETNGLRAFVDRIRGGSPDLRQGLCADEPGRRWLERVAASTVAEPYASRPLDVNIIRRDFPVLRQSVNGRPLAWLDNAATTQKPQSVIDAVSNFYANDNSNIHRGAHTLAARATDAYEKARETIQKFLGAGSAKEIVMVRGTTEGINLVTQTWGRKFLQPGDEVVLSTLEHHANIVPWQMVAKERGAVLRVIPVTDRGEIMLEQYQQILGPKTRVVALAHASNSLGTILPIAEMTQMAKRYGARVLIDGAQSVAHIPVNVQDLGCDWFVFSGHKIFGPMGVGAVYVTEELHDVMPPWQGGGNMIRDVTFEETKYSEAPGKFEAGTPTVADAVGLRAALDYVNRLGLSNIARYEHELLEYATGKLLQIDGLRLIGTAREKVGVLSFVLPGYRSEEIGKLLDAEGIAVRSGHHCSQPSLRRFGVETTVRPSLSVYNTKEEIDRLATAVSRLRR